MSARFRLATTGLVDGYVISFEIKTELKKTISARWKLMVLQSVIACSGSPAHGFGDAFRNGDARIRESSAAALAAEWCSV